MQAIEGQDDHHDEVRDEQRGVEPVPAIEMLEGVVAVVVAEVVAEVMFRLKECDSLRDGDEACHEWGYERFEQGRASAVRSKQYCTVLAVFSEISSGAEEEMPARSR